ncbi:MAG: preprotein translocase subunit SecY [Candidatus Magasanikbacteria bacterium RIFCSPHIGHO2_01_FULL_41_23]|uniref:Protein translocase subunit SecY n=1 Tax=Candidatus Magasanikbacteria bacterium RIFCSPLOWO2_01_FULL_40_15 TaxID=1798686 RepID=A0A1F6N2R0_9BACT|nr:MAG: preprotein translocase subunit SecY [Candidatus Magasanikbacteria bacterium RIFCSPHIGHO2_01_FULL_41_23]OGH66827.1 MAG: preprotein translocase subunit SecY [Candidatus Magasanikbacteria bacterium RIFCSPHIGHO2_02_FULL_41_35]OGH76654.1 MAG: preprotein translocase subunit SecY [Candidatus Magasanikbacteria bacterium RIFCSPHIGHO2_12_FULL_41_16]OGH77990.1 MAG: preprotein translocase subunit SecY [Candidatus Magasanikbacteria bacterium RIFCSPLOWO2_01_FULL_40_15]
MMEKIRRVWQTTALRNNILFVVAMLVIFRIAAHIPVPGVNTENLRRFLEGNQILGLLNIFSGGTMENFSIVLMGVGPYITASIIFQLLTMVIPSLEELSKEGESGQQKINLYTRLATVPLSFLQAFGMIKLLSNAQYGIITDLSMFKLVSIMITVTAGTIFLMWIGELITERKVGNGVSLLIFAGIVASLPRMVQSALANYTSSDVYLYLVYLVLTIVTIVGVVVISEGQRNIPVNYAKQIRGNRTFGGAKTHLPLRLNMAGVIPIIFAISVILFPSMIAQFFVNGTGRSAQLAQWVVSVLSDTSAVYAILYFSLVVGFTYFYTAVIFHPQKMSENLQRQGAFIPGIRPGRETGEYLGKTMSRLLLPGSLFLGLIAVLPLIVRSFTGAQSLAIGGTSLLIVVSVAIETTKQIEAQLTMYEYDRV